MIPRSIQTVTSRTLLCVAALVTFACSVAPTLPLIKTGPPASINSFMGVQFGETLDEVEHRFPMGASQTSPYGAPGYKVENVNSGSIEYQDVIYEFADRAGMQMMIAHFVPSESVDVYQQLQTTFGAPSSAGATTEGAATLEAAWQLSDGSSVMFSGPFHRLALVGKQGSSLKADIRLRDTDDPMSAS